MLKHALCAAAGGALVYWYLKKRDCGCHAAAPTTSASSTPSADASPSVSLAKSTACADCSKATSDVAGAFAL